MENKETNPTIVHNYYGITFQNCSMPNASIQTISQPSADARHAPEASIPEAESDTIAPDASLCTPRAKALLKRLAEAGLVDEHWMPRTLSNAEKGVLASLLADRLDLSTPWQTFGGLWGIKPENLRSAYNKGMEQRKTTAFMGWVKEVME